MSSPPQQTRRKKPSRASRGATAPAPESLTGIRTDAAAKLLGTNVNTLRSWERRFGFPKPGRTKSDHRRYEFAQLQALREALEETGEIATAVEMAKDRLARASETETAQRDLERRLSALEGTVRGLEGRLRALETNRAGRS